MGGGDPYACDTGMAVNYTTCIKAMQCLKAMHNIKFISIYNCLSSTQLPHTPLKQFHKLLQSFRQINNVRYIHLPCVVSNFVTNILMLNNGLLLFASVSRARSQNSALSKVTAIIYLFYTVYIVSVCHVPTCTYTCTDLHVQYM